MYLWVLCGALCFDLVGCVWLLIGILLGLAVLLFGVVIFASFVGLFSVNSVVYIYLIVSLFFVCFVVLLLLCMGCMW